MPAMTSPANPGAYCPRCRDFRRFDIREERLYCKTCGREVTSYEPVELPLKVLASAIASEASSKC